MPVHRYRVHLVLTAAGFTRPHSFRTEIYAESHQQAAEGARKWALEQPLTDIEIVLPPTTELALDQPILYRGERH